MKRALWRRTLGAVLISTAISACSTLGSTSFASLRPSATRILLPVPFQRQHTENECALAAASMVAAYYQQPLQPQTIASLKADAGINGGVSGRALETALEQSDFYSVIFHGSFSDGDTGLYHHLKRGRPIIIMLTQYGTLNGRRTQYGHYVVVVGFDAARGKEFVLDPLRGAVVYSKTRLRNYWKNSDYFSALVMPNHLVPGVNSKSAY
ncbi:MAG: C39 family peptidase [Gammaproteobacteria bacterium]|nr:C39 family peptidase [Gammaproteobacteria bacterium]